VKPAAQETNARRLPQDIEEVFRLHHELVYRTAYRITGSAEDAEDVLQTLFLRLLRRERPPDLERNPKGYLHRSAVNIALDVIKVRRRHVSNEEDAVDSANASERSDVQECLRRALTELSPKAAEIFLLRHVEGYDNAEIASMLGTSKSTVAVLLFRARLRLKKSIRSQYGERS
jgi:RNA polymerase sigma-70 factor, ECF subfamily